MKTYIILLVSLVCLSTQQLMCEPTYIERTIEEELNELNRAVPEIERADLGYDVFDQFADDDEVQGDDYQMAQSPMPTWLRRIGVSVLLGLMQLQEYASNSLDSVKKLLSYGIINE